MKVQEQFSTEDQIRYLEKDNKRLREENKRLANVNKRLMEEENKRLQEEEENRIQEEKEIDDGLDAVLEAWMSYREKPYKNKLCLIRR